MTYAGRTLMTTDAGAWPMHPRHPGAYAPHAYGAFPFVHPARQAATAAARVAPKLRKRLAFDPFGFSHDAGAVVDLDAGAVMAFDAGAVIEDSGYIVSDAGFLVSDAGFLVSDAGAVIDVGFLDTGFLDTSGITELDLLDADAGFVMDAETGALMLMSNGPLADLEAAGFFDDVVKFFKKKVAPIAKSIEKAAAPWLDKIQTAASMIPGYGSIVSGALGAVRGLAQGKSLTQSAMQGFGSMIPGGAIGQGIAQTALGMVEGAIKGKSAAKVAKSALAAIPVGNKGGKGPDLTGLAQKILASPSLRNLPTAQLASVLKTTPTNAHAAQQLIMARIGKAAPAGKSIEQALALIGTPAPAVANPQISAARPMVPMMNFASLMRRDAAGIDPNMPSIYVVEPGDTYVRIAAKLGHPGQYMDLYKANPQVPRDSAGNPALFPGMRINVPAPWQVANQGVPPSPYSLPYQIPADGGAPIPAPIPGQTGPVFIPARGYLVQPGDTYSKICAQFGHPGEEMALIRANPQVPDPNKIFPGMLLNLPMGWGGQGETPPPAPAPAPTPAPVPAQPMPQVEVEPVPTGIPPWLDPNSPEFGKYPTPMTPAPTPTPSPGQTPLPFPAPGPGSIPLPQPQPQPQQQSSGGVGGLVLPLALLFLLGK